MAVYDDVRGWNTEPYLGQGEFYLEYGDIDYEVTVPAGLHRRRHRRAAEPGRGADRRRSSRGSRRRRSPTRRAHRHRSRSCARVPRARRRQGSLTWRFRANNVRDVAWAASPDYLWDAVELGGHPGPGLLPSVGRSRPGRTRPR